MDGISEVLRAISSAISQQAAWIRSLQEIRAPTDTKGWILVCSQCSGQIRLGDRNFEDRLKKVNRVLEFLQREKIDVSYIDLRFDEQGVLITPKNILPENWIQIATRFPGETGRT
jgi:cell division septal protein FtsQ